MSGFIPDYFLSESENFLDKEFNDFRVTFNDTYSQIAQNVNRKDLGYYAPTEIVNGQRWYSDPQNYKTVYRKRVDIGALPNNTTKNTEHGITITATTVVTRIYGAATDPSTNFIPLPYVAANSIYLSMDATNIIIQSTNDKSGFTTAYVVVEYIQE